MAAFFSSHSVRKPKFFGIRTKWETRRESRQKGRIAQGKKPLVEPLVIAPVEERQAAVRQGKMIFYNRQERISLPLSKTVAGTTALLLGVFRTHDGRLFSLRARPNRIDLFEVLQQGKRFFEATAFGWVAKHHDLGHMQTDLPVRGMGLGTKAVSLAERHERNSSGNTGSHQFRVDQRFLQLFQKLHYTIIPGFDTEIFSAIPINKTGRFRPKENLNRFYRIEAIDPKTGKARLFTFPIPNQK